MKKNFLQNLLTVFTVLLLLLIQFPAPVYVQSMAENEEQIPEENDVGEEEERSYEEDEEEQDTGVEEPETGQGTITVRYLDENGEEIGEAVVREFDLGEYTFEAKSIEGYHLISPVNQTVVISNDGVEKEVVFEYREHPPEPGTGEDEVVEPEERETTVQGIRLVSEPHKTTYPVGEELELDGLVVYRQLSSGEEEEVPLELMSVTGFNSEEVAEDQLVTLGHHGFNAEFTVDIVEGEDSTLFARIFQDPLFGFMLFLVILLLILLILTAKRNKEKDAQPAKSEEGGHIVEDEAPSEKDERKIRAGKIQRKRYIKLLVVLLLLGLFAYGCTLYLLGRVEQGRIAEDDEALGISQDSGRPGITNIAVFGIDAGDGMTGRSDAIMILTLDEINNKIKITSIMRDSYVKIPGRGLDKINHAYAFGGPELAIKTINTSFDLDVRHYVSVNFSSMPVLVDAAGGVEVEVTDREAREIPGIQNGGVHVLNGLQALEFSRIRKIDSDFARARRQRDIMQSIMESALDAPVTSYPSMINQVFPHLTTNMSSNQMLYLGGKAVMKNINHIQHAQFPPPSLGRGQTINRVYYYVFDREEGRIRLSRYIYYDEPLE